MAALHETPVSAGVYKGHSVLFCGGSLWNEPGATPWRTIFAHDEWNFVR